MAAYISTSASGFNPHLHVGGDKRKWWDMIASGVSIHTSTWEVTNGTTGIWRLGICFNPHLHVGGDSCHRSKSADRSSFNPHLHVGGDSVCRPPKAAPGGFNPHLHVGGDVPVTPLMPWVTSFNPHLHVGGDQFLYC